MSSRSDRYARWFGTRVPASSRSFMLILTSGISLAFAFPLLQLWLLFGPLLYSIIVAAIAFAVHFLIVALQKTWLETDITNGALNEIVSNIYQETILPSDVHVWIRRSDVPYITSTYTILFKAVILSEPMVDLILQSPDSGKALLGFHFLRMPKDLWIADSAGGAIAFYAIAFLLDALIIPTFYTANPYLYLVLITLLGSTAMLGALLALSFARSVFWRHETAFESTVEVFGIHPQVAKVQVERGYELDNDEHHAVLWGVLEWEKGKRSGRRYGSAISSLLAVVLPGLIYGTFNPEIMYYQPLLLTIQLPLIGILLAFAIFFIVRHWDKSAMASVLYATEGAREPIWMD